MDGNPGDLPDACGRRRSVTPAEVTDGSNAWVDGAPQKLDLVVTAQPS